MSSTMQQQILESMLVEPTELDVLIKQLEGQYHYLSQSSPNGFTRERPHQNNDHVHLNDQDQITSMDIQDFSQTFEAQQDSISSENQSESSPLMENPKSTQPQKEPSYQNVPPEQYVPQSRPSQNPVSSQQQKNGYPTKNFLQFLKPILINVVVRADPSAKKHPKIVKFEDKRDMNGKKVKKSMNMKDVEELFNEEDFRPYFQEYFRQNKLYHDLTLSRVKTHLKLIYHGKLGVIYKAFRTREFKKIN